MESTFNLEHQNSNLDSKIVAGLERISQVFKTLLWEKSKTHNLSPIQIQILIFIQYHNEDICTVSYLAQEFNLTKATISDTIKTLEQKQFIKKIADQKDNRSYKIALTDTGKNTVKETENFVNPLKEIIATTNIKDQMILWENITNIILQLNELQIISVQRTCVKCKHYTEKNKHPFCNLLEQNLKTEDIRIDCEEFELNAINSN